MKEWSKMYLINPKDMDHLLGELRINGFNAYDPNPENESSFAKIQVEQPDNLGMGGFLFNRDSSWHGYPFHVWGDKLDTFMQKYKSPSASDSSPSR